MSQMDGIELEIVWLDGDAFELRVCAGNGRFAGTTNVYVPRDGLSDVAETFRGFPDSPDDRRELKLGTFDEEQAGGGAHLLLACSDEAGHAGVEVTLRTDPRADPAGPATAGFVVPVEAAAIDAFVEVVEAMAPETGSVARLPRAT